MRGADHSSKSSDSLLGTAAILQRSSSPLPIEKDSTALFPVKEEIYDLDYPELQELQKKLVRYLQEATSSSSRRTSAIGLLRLVKLEIRERESCACMLENILSVQNTCTSQNEGDPRVQNFAYASAPVATPAGAEVATAAADDRKASLPADPSKSFPETYASSLLSTKGQIHPATSTYSKREKSMLSLNALASRKDGVSFSVNSTVSSLGDVTFTANPRLGWDRSSSTLQNSSALIASKAPGTALAVDSVNSAQARSRVSNFVALEKKVFGEGSSPFPTLSVRSPLAARRCDAQVACVPPFRVVKRCRRRACGMKLPVPKCGAHDTQKKIRRKRCSGELLTGDKVRATCSIERHPLKEKPHRRREKATSKAITLHCDSHPCVPLAETHSAITRAGSLGTAASTEQQNEQQKPLKSQQKLGDVAGKYKFLPLEEQSTTEGFNGQQDPVEDICKVSKAEASSERKREGRTKLRGSCDSPAQQSSHEDGNGRVGRETFTTARGIRGDNNSKTSVNLGTAPLPVADSVKEPAPAIPPKRVSIDISYSPADGGLSAPSRAKSAALVEAEESNEEKRVAIVVPPAVEVAVPARPSDLKPEEPTAKSSSHVFRTAIQQEKGRQPSLQRASHSCTEDLQCRKAAQAGPDERGGRDRTKPTYCVGGLSLAKDSLARREEAARQRSGSTGSTRKNVLLKQKKGSTIARSASKFGEELDVIETCVYHELAHMSIRNSARGVIGDIDSIIQAMSRNTPEQVQKGEAVVSVSTAPTTTTIVAAASPKEATAREAAPKEKCPCFPGMPCRCKTTIVAAAASKEATAREATPEEKCPPCPSVPCHCTMEGQSKQGEASKEGNSNRMTLTVPKSAFPSSNKNSPNTSETAELPHFDGSTKRSSEIVVDTSKATMEKVYALLAGLGGPPSTEKCTNRSTPLQRSGTSGSTALGWRIQIGNEDEVDPTCQTISIKKSQENEEGESCLLVEEGNSSPSRTTIKTRNHERGGTGGCYSVSQASKSWSSSLHSSPLHRKRHLSLTLKKPNFPSEGETAASEDCGHKEDNCLLLNIQRQFPTLGDLLAESDKSKHACVLREILINNGKCCADLSHPGTKKTELVSSRKSENMCHRVTRFYKVEKSRPEVLNIVCRALRKEEDWEPIPEGQHWEYGWNLLWTWRPPRINYNKLLSFQKVNHFPEARHLTRKDRLKECIEKYQKLAGKRSEIFKIIPKTYCMPKEHIALFNDMCEAEEQKRKSIWICKPKDSSRGRGIYLAGSIREIKYAENILVQEYIANPLLLNGRKFDLRLYVLVTSFNPLEAFVYKQGFARVARVPFSLDPEHFGNRFMHLTNASVQTKWQDPSDSEDEATWKEVFENDSPSRSCPGFNSVEHWDERDTRDSRSICGEGSKLLLDELRIRLEQSGLDWDPLWNRIVLVILKSLSCCSDFIPFQPNSFELFGYDILIDAEAKPWLIEVNSSPCMSQEYDIDKKIKPTLIEDTIRLVNPVAYDRFKLSNIIAGRLSEAGSAEEHSTALVSPRRAYPPNPQTKAISAFRSCSPPNSTSPSSSTSSSSCRRGLLTHRPSRKATPDVKHGSEDWRKSRRRHVKQQHQQDLLALLNHTKPREYGEMPVALGNYERIAPSKPWYQLQMLKHSLLGRHQ